MQNRDRHRLRGPTPSLDEGKRRDSDMMNPLAPYASPNTMLPATAFCFLVERSDWKRLTPVGFRAKSRCAPRQLHNIIEIVVG
jgi:hypothetical protein